MTDIAIRVENLSKQYRIGARQASYKTLRDTLADAVAAPFRRIRSTFQRANVPRSNDTHIWALKDVSFEVRRGEVVGIIGRNGAGKTTLLKVLSRITEPTEGQAEIRGRVGSLLEVGTGFHPELTGRENVYLNGAILGMRRAEIEAKFAEIVAFAEVEKFLDTPVKHYSSGMYVRLAFAVAAHLEPEILLVDEVLAVGDAAFQKKCLGKMGAVASEGYTVLFVSHNMGSVVELTERCMLLESGALVADGCSQAVVERYLRRGGLSLSRDLSKVERPFRKGSKPRWQITHVEIRSQGRDIAANDPIEVELKYVSFGDLEDIGVGLGIANLFGTRLVSCRSEDSGLTISSSNGDVGAVLVRIQANYLAPGVYVLQVGAGMGNHYTLDYVPDALRFQVAGRANDSWGLDRSSLGMRLPSQWVLIERATSHDDELG